jgi:hypothetical protein
MAPRVGLIITAAHALRLLLSGEVNLHSDIDRAAFLDETLCIPGGKHMSSMAAAGCVS